MNRSDRRQFLAEVGQGMTAVLVGPALAHQLGVGAEARGDDKSKTPAGIDRLAKLIQETRPEKLLGVFKGELDKGTTLREMVAAGALANARAFAGQDYDGYHTFMALAPSFTMASELPEKDRPLPVFKVLYRNSSLISGSSRCHHDHLGEPVAAPLDPKKTATQQLIEASRTGKVAEADHIAVAMSKGRPEEAYEQVQPLVQDYLNVHQVVLAWRAWEILDFLGKEHARTMLRQTVRHAADYANHGVGHQPHGIREALPKLLDEHRLLGKTPGTRKGDDAWVEKLAATVYGGGNKAAATAVAAALAEGFAPDSVCEAISLAATTLVLRDKGRGRAWPGKPVKSVHGDSVGVHASDAANAWRRIAGVTGARNTFASLIASAYHTSGQTGNQMPKAYPLSEDVEKVEGRDAAALLGALDEAVRGNDQARACAVVQRYGQLGLEEKGVFAVLLKYGVSEDGALHAEKYYRTVRDEFARTRPSFRWRHLVALARVTASEYGRPAPGLEEARRVFKA
jgi:hypothetical protein